MEARLSADLAVVAKDEASAAQAIADTEAEVQAVAETLKQARGGQAEIDALTVSEQTCVCEGVATL